MDAPSTWSSKIVGKVPKTCISKRAVLMTSTEDMSESMIRETLVEESMEIAFALLVMRNVVFVHLLMRTDCVILASISIISEGLS